jgi:sugar lactone lactonase YvrE
MTTTPAAAATTGTQPPTPTIITVAGTGSAGFSGDGGPATSARLQTPEGVTVNSSGTLYIADYGNHRVRQVTRDGVIATVAGTGSAGYGGDGGPATAAQLHFPYGVAVDSAGTLYIAEFGNHRVRQVTRDGVITTVAGTGSAGYGGDGGPATAAQLNHPCGVAVDKAGTLYIVDDYNDRVRQVTPDGVITTVAGTGSSGYSGDSGDGGPATAAPLNHPVGVAVDNAGTLYITEWHHHRVRRVAPDGVITTVAGTRNSGYSGDGGPASSAHLNTPSGVAVDNAGTLYITDDFNHRIRQVTRDGVITTVAGTGSAGHGGDNGPAVAAHLNNPVGVAVDSAGALYITERDSHRVRKVTGVAEAVLPVN